MLQDKDHKMHKTYFNGIVRAKEKREKKNSAHDNQKILIARLLFEIKKKRKNRVTVEETAFSPSCLLNQSCFMDSMRFLSFFPRHQNTFIIRRGYQ